MGISFWRYLTDHFTHHKDVTKESFSYNYQRMDSKSLPVRVIGFVLHASMINHFVDTLKWIGFALTGKVEEKLSATRPGLNQQIVRRVESDYLMMAALLILAVVVTIAFYTDLVIQLWLVPMIIGWAPIHALIDQMTKPKPISQAAQVLPADMQQAIEAQAQQEIKQEEVNALLGTNTSNTTQPSPQTSTSTNVLNMLVISLHLTYRVLFHPRRERYE